MAFSGAQLTRLGLGGFTRGLYGSFAGKELNENEAGPHNPGEITRLGLAAITRGLYGDFSGKAEAEPEPEVVLRNVGGWLPSYGRKRKRWKEIQREEQREVLETLERIYERINGEAPAAVIEVVAPYTKGNKPRTRPPASRRVDFVALSKNIRAVENLVKIARQAQHDEAVALLLLM